MNRFLFLSPGLKDKVSCFLSDEELKNYDGLDLDYPYYVMKLAELGATIQRDIPAAMQELWLKAFMRRGLDKKIFEKDWIPLCGRKRMVNWL